MTIAANNWANICLALIALSVFVIFLIEAVPLFFIFRRESRIKKLFYCQYVKHILLSALLQTFERFNCLTTLSYLDIVMSHNAVAIVYELIMLICMG